MRPIPFDPRGFVLLPKQFIVDVLAVDLEKVERIYREAYEKAQAIVLEPVSERFQPSRN